MSKLLEKYLKAIEQKKEIMRLEVLRKAASALNKLSKERNFKYAYIFGSVLKPKKFYRDSDVDIAVEGLKDKDFFYFISRAQDIIGREVDVMQLEKHRLKERIIKEGLLWKKRAL